MVAGQEDVMRFLPLVVLSAVLSTSAAFASAPTGEVRLRPQNSRLELAIKEGSARSATFRALVDRIERSDVIVYVAHNPTMKSSLSGMLTWMTRSGPYRYVRASIAKDLSLDQMIATVAHELQHAVEVIEDESVVDEKSLVALYRRIGSQSSASSPTRWETAAAQEAGFQVRRELIAAPASATIARGTMSQS
jgi:hypothetical protein